LKSSSRKLPPPTPSEAAFECAFRALKPSEGASSSTAHPRRAEPDGSPRDVSAFVEHAFANAKEYAKDRYASIGEASQFHTKIAGVSFEGRQDTIAGLTLGSELILEREPENVHDANAIAVRFGALPLGYISRGIAKHIAPLIDEGARYRARIESLTGGGDKNRGVNVYVWRDAAPRLRSATLGVTRGEADRDNEEMVRAALIGDARPHHAQLQALERIEAGRNTLVVLGTGRGKSFCFQYPAGVRALASGAKTLALYPLRALANDQYEGLLRKFDPLGLRIHRANGSISHDEREALFEALHSGEWDIILATPEFLEYHQSEFTGSSRPELVVVDEAHHIFESKHRAAYGRLGETIAALNVPQVLALTATANDEAFETIRRSLRINAWVIDPTVRENLHVVDARGTGEKTGYLLDLFGDGAKGIVYCNSRAESTRVAETLRKKLGNTVMFYHAGLPTPERHDVERYFREGALQVVVATSAFGEGIDLPDVRHVVLYHLNFDFTEFNQQAGRAGRDGEPADIHLLYGEKDRFINDFIIDRDAPTLETLRSLYRGIKGLSSDGFVRSTFADIARSLDFDKVNGETVSHALHLFEDEGLVEIAVDDDGRYVRFLPVERKIDLELNERFAEGEATRESFKRFAALALTAKADALERIINRPIYPQSTELVR